MAGFSGDKFTKEKETEHRIGHNSKSYSRTQEEIELHLKSLTDPDSADFSFTFPLIKPRSYQLKAWRDYHSGIKNIIISLPRRAGKDVTSLSIAVDYAMNNPNSAVVLLAPDGKWAKKIYWSAGQELFVEDQMTGLPRKLSGTMLDMCCPFFLRKYTNKSNMVIGLKNGSTIQLLGSAEKTFVGMRINCLVVSEMARHDKDIFSLLSPVLLESNGLTIYNGTVEDETNHFWDLIQKTKAQSSTHSLTYLTAQQTKQYYWLSPVREDGTREFSINLELAGEINPFNGRLYDNIQQMLESGETVSYLIREFLNIPTSVEEGSYYAALIGIARSNGRITEGLTHDPAHPVYLAMDIGMSDMNSLIWFQYYDDIVRFIDYYENNGKEIGHYIDIIRSKSYNIYAAWAPHDASKRSIQTGLNLLDFCRSEYDYNFNYLTKSGSIINDINVVRAYFQKMEFDARTCRLLLAQLSRYHQGPNGKPKHDDASHGADAFRYSIMCIHKGLVSAVKAMGYDQTDASNMCTDLVLNVDDVRSRENGRIDSVFMQSVDDFEMEEWL